MEDQAMGEAHDDAAVAIDGEGQTSSSPASLAAHVHSISRKLRRHDNETSTSESSAAVMQGLQEAREALLAKADASFLTHREWEWLSSIEMFAGNAHSGPVQLSLERLTSVLATMERAGRESAGSRLHLPALARHARAILHWHTQYAGIGVDLEEEADEAPTDAMNDSDEEDPLLDWAGVRGGPLVRGDARGKYRAMEFVPASLPIVPAEARGSMEWEQILGEQAVRTQLREINTRAAEHWAGSHFVWQPYYRFEVAHLARNPKDEEAVERVKRVFLARLATTHKDIEATFQKFSTFVSAHLPANAYESTMSSSQKAYSSAKARYQTVEAYEDALSANDTTSFATWQPYVTHAAGLSLQRKAGGGRNQQPVLDEEAVAALYERALADIGLPSYVEGVTADAPPPLEEPAKESRSSRKKRGHDELESMQRDALKARQVEAESCWTSYISFLNAPKSSPTLFADAIERAVKAAPGSGTLWAQNLRGLTKLRRPKVQVDEGFSRALQAGEVQRDAAALVDLLLGRIDAEREYSAVALAEERGVEVGEAIALLRSDLDKFMEVYGFMSYALGQLEEHRCRDPSLRLERLTSSWLQTGGEEVAALAEPIWQGATKAQPKNELAWLEAARFYARRGDVKQARSHFKLGTSRVDAPEAKDRISDEWVAFEHVWGGAAEVEYAEQRRRQERERMWSAWYEYQQQQQQSASVAATTNAANATHDLDMADVSMASDSGAKRRAPDAVGAEAGPSGTFTGDAAASKKGKADDAKPTRDRENCSILVTNLPVDATQDEIVLFFADCGSIEEVTGPRKVDEGASAAAVEFSDRSAVPAARTRDLKRLREHEIGVILGWESTLYVTNFPDEVDDVAIRDLFSRHGKIFNVRWPSKKFDNSRRFCYVQFTSKDAAQAALVEHDRKLSPLHTLQVFLSDPSRRKTRSDANATDRELYISGLPRSASVDEVRAMLEQHGEVDGFRMPLLPDGKAKGIAFADMRTPLDAQKAVTQLRDARINGKAISVTLAEKRASSHGGANDVASLERRLRSIKLSGLPHDAQEALIQQMVERELGHGTVRSVRWTPGEEGKGVAVVELVDTALAGRASFLPGLVYDDRSVRIGTLESRGAAARLPSGSAKSVGRASASPPPAASAVPGRPAAGVTPPAAVTAFAPRVARGGLPARGRGRGRGGLGFVRPAQAVTATAAAPGSMDVDASTGSTGTASQHNGGAAADAHAKPKTQESFREMLKKG